MRYLNVLFLLVLTSAVHSQTLNSVESVEYDAEGHRWLASNGNNVIVVDGNGDELDYFGTDPEADYGMEVMNGVLYAVVGSSVRGYSLADGTEVFNVPIAGAGFLNGLASDGVNRLWVTDFGSLKIHEIDVAGESATEVVSNTVSTPNGIVYDETNNRLVFVNWGSSAKIKAVDLSDYSVTTLQTTSLGNLDGIDNDLAGNFYVASWSPTRITRFSNEFAMDEIITAPGISSPADICYAEEVDSLAIPNTGNNTITFVGFGATTVAENATGITPSAYPLPLQESSVIAFQTTQAGAVQVDLFDVRGQLVTTLLQGDFPPASHKILLAGLEIPAGVYFCSIQSPGGNFVMTLPKQ